MAEQPVIQCADDLQAEEWRAISVRPAYEISNLGRVRSLDRAVHYLRHGRPVTTRCKGRLLNQTRCKKTGYFQVSLGRPRDGIYNRFDVHPLVLAAFVCPRPEGKLALHSDGLSENNKLGNLRWGTRTENAEDARLHGSMLLGDYHPNAVLRAADIRVIRELLKSRSLLSVAREMGVSKGCISQIKTRRTWAHIP